MNYKYINGPSNIIRLENEYKKIYLMLDFHQEAGDELQCSDVINSIDINKFLSIIFNNLTNSSIICDFFLEIRREDILKLNRVNFTNRGSYIQELFKLFQQYYKNVNNTKVSVNKQFFPNVRMHYMDIRDVIGNSIIQKIIEIESILDSYESYIFNFNIINTLLSSCLNDMKIFYNILYNNAKDTTGLLNKIRNSYDNPRVKKRMNEILDIEVRKQFDFVILELEKYSSLITRMYNSGGLDNTKLFENKEMFHREEIYNIDYGYSTSYLKNIYAKLISAISILYLHTEDIFTLITDVYFMRRFLDKKYITNGIVYVGANHIFNYLDTLIKNFDFKITHISYSSKKYLGTLNQSLINANKYNYGQLIFPDIFRQCSNIESFPTIPY